MQGFMSRKSLLPALGRVKNKEIDIKEQKRLTGDIPLKILAVV